MADLTPITAPDTLYADRLRALRDHLVEQLEDAPPGTIASIAKQLLDTLAKLEAVAPVRTESALDDLAKARAARRANPGL